MGNVADVVKRCLSYEDETGWFEFKSGTAVSGIREIGEYISALSNAAVMSSEPFGYLIWGIDNDTHEITGTKFNYTKDVDHEPFEHRINRNVSPTMYFHFDEDEIDGKRVVVLTIPAAQVVPTAYEGERFIRIGSSKENLRKHPEREAELFKILLSQRAPTDNWELQKSKYHVKDINTAAFETYLRKAKETARIELDSDAPIDVLNSIEVADGDVLLNAGAAIFVDSGINELQMARYATDERLTILDSKRLTGSILGLTDKAVLYISDAMDWRSEFNGNTRRDEIPEIPTEAVREAIINAFAHRLIESRQPVDVAIFKSYIEIYSPGLFPQNLEPEDFIRSHVKPPRRNPLIAKTLYYSKDMEALATGFKRIDKFCTKAGVKYEFFKETYGFTVRFYRHCGEGWNQAGNHAVSEKGQEKRHEKGHETKGAEIAERKTKIIELLKSDSNLSIPTLAESMNISEKQVRTALDHLKEEGRLHYEGNGRGGRWIVD